MSGELVQGVPTAQTLVWVSSPSAGNVMEDTIALTRMLRLSLDSALQDITAHVETPHRNLLACPQVQ